MFLLYISSALETQYLYYVKVASNSLHHEVQLIIIYYISRQFYTGYTDFDSKWWF